MINVQEYQITKKEKEISENLLKNGKVVTSFEVNKAFNKFYETHVPGLPYFKPIKLEQYERSDKKHWNNMFTLIEEDLNTIYDVYKMQYDNAILLQSVFSNKIEILNNKIDALIIEESILQKYSKLNIAYDPYLIYFNNLRNVNTKNLVKQNIPYTTSEIDFNTSTLRNILHSTPNDRIDLNNAEISINANNFIINCEQDYKNAFSDNMSKPLNIELVSSAKELPILEIDVTLDKVQEASRIELTGYSIYNTNLRLFVSRDGVNFLEREEKPGGKYNIFRFNKEYIKSIKIIIEKNDADYSAIDAFYYYYTLSNISIFNDKYSKVSVYTSNKINLDTTTSDIIVTPEHNLPPKTDISYFAGLEDNEGNVEWKPIIPDELYDLKTLEREEFILNYFTSKHFGETDFDRSIKKFCFYIHGLHTNTNLNSIYLRAGHSQWLLERLDVTDKYGVDYPVDKKINLSDYNKARVTEIAPLDATILDLKCEKENNYIVMTQHVVCDKEVIIENRKIEFDTSGGESFDTAILINGKQILPKDNKYAFKLNEGENIVKIVFLLCGLNISNIETTKRIRHNFNLMPYSKLIFAGPKMSRISYNTLVNSVSSHSLKYFSLKIIDGLAKVVTKFDPNYIIKPSDPNYSNVDIDKKTVTEAHVNNSNKISDLKEYRDYIIPDIKINNSEYFRMYIKYKHMTPSKALKYVSKNNKINIRIMAKLNTGDYSVTPSINSIKVVGE